MTDTQKRPNPTPSKFIGEYDTDKRITSIQVSYAGQTRPQPALALSYPSESFASATKETDYLTRAWIDTQIELSKFDKNNFASEPKKKWLELGMFYSFIFEKPSGSVAGTAVIDISRTTTNPAASPIALDMILLLDFSKFY